MIFAVRNTLVCRYELSTHTHTPPACPPVPALIHAAAHKDTATNGRETGVKRVLEDTGPSLQQKSFAAGRPGARLLSSAVMQSVQPAARASASSASAARDGKRRKSAGGDGAGGVSM